MKCKIDRQLWVVLVVALGSASLLRGADGEEKKKREIQANEIVLLDVARVFKENVAFKAAMDMMKQDVKDFEDEVRKQRDAINERAMEAALDGIEPAKVEAEKLKAMSELEVKMKLKRKALMEQEAHLYAATYEDIQTEVQAHAKKHEIRLVLRFNSDKIDPDDRDKVLQGVNNTIVFQDRLDITEVIIERLNGKAASVDPREEAKLGLGQK